MRIGIKGKLFTISRKLIDWMIDWSIDWQSNIQVDRSKPFSESLEEFGFSIYWGREGVRLGGEIVS